MLRIKKNAGFSLVELMVVVAIIGILAAVAIPNFTRFQRKARAAEAKDMLTAQYNSEQSFLAEWEGYTDDLYLTGYRTAGSIRTTAGFNSAGTTYPTTITVQALTSVAASNTACTSPADTVNTAVMCANCLGMVNVCNLNPAIAAWPTQTVNATQVSAATDGSATFNMVSSEDVGSGTNDVWNMNSSKGLTQLADGVNVN